MISVVQCVLEEIAAPAVLVRCAWGDLCSSSNELTLSVLQVMVATALGVPEEIPALVVMN